MLRNLSSLLILSSLLAGQTDPRAPPAPQFEPAPLIISDGRTVETAVHGGPSGDPKFSSCFGSMCMGDLPPHRPPKSSAP